MQWLYTSQVVPHAHQASSQDATNAVVKETDDASETRQYSVASNGIDLKWVEEENIGLEFYPEFAKNEGAQTISRLLSFLKLAEQIALLGPFDGPIATITDILISSRSALMPGHIQITAQFPPGHVLRKLFGQACMRDYVHDILPRANPKPSLFRFSKEMDELDSFAADLARVYRDMPKKRNISAKSQGVTYIYTDPLTGNSFWTTA